MLLMRLVTIPGTCPSGVFPAYWLGLKLRSSLERSSSLADSFSKIILTWWFDFLLILVFALSLTSQMIKHLSLIIGRINISLRIILLLNTPILTSVLFTFYKLGPTMNRISSIITSKGLDTRFKRENYESLPLTLL